MPRYHFHDFANEAIKPKITGKDCRSDSSARSHAGALAKANGGPVDLAYADDRPWAERYITTAIPSAHHKSGYQFERIEN